MIRRATAGALSLIGAALPFLPLPGATIAPEVRTVLSRDLRFGAADFADLERGKIVKRSVDASAPGEIAVVGAVRINARVEAFVDSVRDIVQFKRSADVIQIGRFSDPPRVEDLAPLTIGRDDLDLRRCRVGSCDVRLSADVIARFQRGIDWKAPDADARAAALFKEVLVENVRAHLSGGPGRMAEYDDEKRPVRPLDDFAALLRNSPYAGALVPAMPGHLQSPSAAPLPGAEELVYWSKEKFGLTPFITVTHVVITQVSATTYVIASRDVYSSRYFDASLSFTIATRAADAPAAFYLVYANRSRAYALKGPFAGLRRSIVERRARNSVEENLKTTKMKLEGGTR